MRLLQFSTSHYCRKARLALGYKQIPYQVQNLTPGLHALQIRPLTGTTTTPVLIPDDRDPKQAIGDSTAILSYLEHHYPDPPLLPTDPQLRSEAWIMEDWLDESIGTATRFVYYQFRSTGEGKALDPSWSSQVVIQIVRRQYGITAATVQLAQERLRLALPEIERRWRQHSGLVGDQLSVADIAAAALLSPLARIPQYRIDHAMVFNRIGEIHTQCGEPLPPGLELEVKGDRA